jgi:hypothetical protein
LPTAAAGVYLDESRSFGVGRAPNASDHSTSSAFIWPILVPARR